MTSYPTVNDLPILSQSNVESVVESMLGELSKTNEENNKYKSFIMAALRRAQRDASHSFRDHTSALEKISSILEVVPQVKVEGARNLLVQDSSKWLDDKMIAHKVIWFQGNFVFFFDNWDDALLFKLWV